MSNQIASLFARLGFDVDLKGLKEFEGRLNQATQKTVAQGNAATKAGDAVDKATNKNRRTQNQLAKEIRRNYAKVRTDRVQAANDIRRINEELASGKLKDNQKRELIEARGRTQQRLDDLIKQEKTAQERLQRQVEAKNKQHQRALERQQNQRRRDMERRDEQAHKVRTDRDKEARKLAERQAARQARLDREIKREQARQRALYERRDEQDHRVRTQRANDARRLAEKKATEQARLDRQAQREKLRLQSIQERRDLEEWRQRGERARQEREQERRHHQQRMRETSQYGRSRNRAMSYRGIREHGRAWIPGIGGAFAAMQSTQSYQGYVGTQAGLTAATGSSEQAGKEFEFLKELSNKLGVFIGDMAQSFTSLSANTRNTSLEGQDTRDIFEAVTSYSRVLNLSAADQDGVFRALTQMVGKGQVYAEELRQQMGERLPGSFQAMARASGYGSDEAGVTAFYKAVENGEIKATKVFPQFAKELMKMANEGGALEKAMNNTAAAIGRFRTNVYLANKTINESGYDKAVRNLMNRSSESIDRSTPFWELLGKTMAQVGKAVEVPIELFGALNQKIPLATEFVKENETAFKLLGVAITAAFKPLRSLFLLVYGMASISDILLDPTRERSWAEWVVQLGLAAAALGTILGTLRSIFRVGNAVTGIFKGGARIPGAAGTVGAGASGALTTGSLVSALSRVALRVTVVGFAAAVLANMARSFFGDPEKSYSENIIDFGDTMMARNNEWRNNPDYVEPPSALSQWAGGVWDRVRQADQERRGNFGVLNDSNIDAYFNSRQEVDNSRTENTTVHNTTQPDNALATWLNNFRPLIKESHTEEVISSSAESDLVNWLKGFKPINVVTGNSQTDNAIPSWASMYKPNDKEGDSDVTVTTPGIDNELVRWLKDVRESSQSNQSNFGVLNDSNIDAYFASRQRSTQEPTRQFIGDVHITVESSDPQMAGLKVEEAFQNIFSRELRITSASQQITEK